MQYARLGTTGVQVSRICLGCMSFGNTAEWMVEIDKATPIIKSALDLGINFFDTANVYSKGRSEEIVGELLRDVRNDVFINSKVMRKVGNGPNDQGLSRYHIQREVEKSLNRLNTDRIDLYQIHRWDYNTPIKETLLALDDLVHQGKIRYIGASSMFAWQFAKALFTSDLLGTVRFVSMQNLYNLLYREEEREMIRLCKDQGIGIIPYAPLAKGLLTGGFKRGEKPNIPRYKTDHMLSKFTLRAEDFDVMSAVDGVAKERGVSSSQVALAWLLHKGVTSTIVGVSKIHHLDEAVAAVDLKLSSDDMKRLEEPYKVRALVGYE